MPVCPSTTTTFLVSGRKSGRRQGNTALTAVLLFISETRTTALWLPRISTFHIESATTKGIPSGAKG